MEGLLSHLQTDIGDVISHNFKGMHEWTFPFSQTVKNGFSKLDEQLAQMEGGVGQEGHVPGSI